MKYLLDTNIIIYALKGQFPALPRHFANTASQSILIPAVVMAEIEYGARKSYDYEKTIAKYRRFTDVFKKIPFSEKAALFYGQIRRDLEKQGLSIGPNDLMIAATAMAEDGILITKNTREFLRIPDLRIQDWTEA